MVDLIDGACCQPTMHIHAPSPNPPTSCPINSNDAIMIPSSNPTSSPLSKKLDDKVQPKNEKELSLILDGHDDNPFGYTAVGEIKAVLKCIYYNNDKSGILYITERAICFRHIGLFGFEISRLVIPFDVVKNIYSENNIDRYERIVIETDFDKMSLDGEKICHFFLLKEQHLLDQALTLLLSTWGELNQSTTTLQKTAINDMFQNITTLTDKTESMSMSDDDNDTSSSEEVHDTTSADNALVLFEKCDSETAKMELWDTFVDNVKRSQYSNKVIKV